MRQLSSLERCSVHLLPPPHEETAVPHAHAHAHALMEMHMHMHMCKCMYVHVHVAAAMARRRGRRVARQRPETREEEQRHPRNISCPLNYMPQKDAVLILPLEHHPQQHHPQHPAHPTNQALPTNRVQSSARACYAHAHRACGTPAASPRALGGSGQLPHCVGKHEPHARTVDADAREHVVDAEAGQRSERAVLKRAT